MLLDTKDRTLKCTLVTAIGAGIVSCTVHYVDKIQEKVIETEKLTTLAAGAVIICPAPADNTAREIAEINITNMDSVTHDTTVTLYDGATPYHLKFQAALAVGKTLHYNRFNGWALV